MDEHSTMGRRLVALVLVLVTLSLAVPDGAAAQWSLEGRIGSAIPVGDLTDDPDPQTAGLTYAGAIYYNIGPALSVYGEVARQDFNCDGCDTDASNWGFDAGLKYIFASQGSALPWARAGVAIQRMSLGDVDGAWGVGVDSGVGIDWLLNEHFALVPALRYDWHGGADDVSVGYVTIDLGAHWHVGR